ncbi:MAG TPA: hypothetical protein VF472_12985 [Burkholderiaceae bacterium]
MSENVEAIDGEDEGAADDVRTRQRSTIGFPYSDYEAAVAVALAIHGNVGHGDCSATSQLAAWMDQSPKSSSYRSQLAAARLFGLIESNDAESYHLTDLGRRVVDQSQARQAKAEAFLRVPLFRALYDKYKGHVTPPSAALEREIAALGVSEKQKGRARQVFESSAQQTGFREQGPNKLVLPAVLVKDADPAKQANANDGNTGGNGGNGGGGTTGLDLDPLLLALLQKIPKQGEQWPATKRLRWFQTFAMNVSQVYDEDDSAVEITVTLQS